MAVTRVSDIIKNSYVLSNAVDPDEELQGYQAGVGLDTLNGIINEWSSLGVYLPVYEKITIALAEGVYEYTVSPVITQFLEGNVVNSANVIGKLLEADLKQQNVSNYALARGIPGQIFIQPNVSDVQNSNLVYFYPTPDQSYTANLYVKQLIAEVTASQVLNDMPKFYYKALIYQMAKELSIINSTVLPQAFLDEYVSVMKNLKAANKKDMSVQNTNPFYDAYRLRPWGPYVG